MQLETLTSVQLSAQNSLSDEIRDTLRVRFEQYGIETMEDENLLHLCVQVAISVMIGFPSDPVWGILRDPKNTPKKRVISAIFGPFHKGKKEIYPSYFTVDEWTLYFQRAGIDALRRTKEILH